MEQLCSIVTARLRADNRKDMNRIYIAGKPAKKKEESLNPSTSDTSTSVASVKSFSNQTTNKDEMSPKQQRQLEGWQAEQFDEKEAV
jgi:hypothetical protein